jgi:hypothetical protein
MLSKKTKHKNDNFCNYFWTYSINNACVGGNIDTLELMIENAHKYSRDKIRNSDMLDYACRGGNMKMIKYIIDKETDEGKVPHWESGMRGACRGGHIDAVLLMIQLKNKVDQLSGHWIPNWGMNSACYRGKINYEKSRYVSKPTQYVEIIKLMIEMGADQWDLLEDYTYDAELYKLYKLHVLN